MSETAHRLQELERHLAAAGPLAIAFSGGVDSTLLAAVAARALGQDCLAVTVRCQVVPAAELDEARELAAAIGIRHVVVDFDWLAQPVVTANPPDRCYHCKGLIFQQIFTEAAAAGIRTVVDGTNTDDLGDYRPGLTALREMGVRSPFVELDIGKETIRAMSRLLRLPDPERPSQACLASRIPYGVTVTGEVLRRVEAAEGAIHALGFRRVRVRVHGAVARIEVAPERRGALLARADEVVSALRGLGFVHVALDLAGYRMGSLNEGLTERESE